MKTKHADDSVGVVFEHFWARCNKSCWLEALSGRELRAVYIQDKIATKFLVCPYLDEARNAFVSAQSMRANHSDERTPATHSLTKADLS